MKPAPVKASLYDTEYYQKYNHGYAHYKSADLMPELRSKLDKIDFQNKSVLDIGCGRGELLLYALKRDAQKVVGIDYSQSAKDYCDQILNTLEAIKRSKVNAQVMDAKKLEFPDQSFDIVVMLDVVEHLHAWELEVALKEAHRVLKSDGLLIAHTSPNKFMMDVVRFFVAPFGIKLKSNEFHVNEQTYFSLNKFMYKLFNGKVIMEKDKKYWSNQMSERGSKLKFIAKILDVTTDNLIAHFILSNLPFSILFGTDLWYQGVKI